jgi:tRNA threonylcarbamoyladenosine dehydratase
LASKIKWKLKKFNVSPDDVMTVFSVEKPVKELLPLSDEQHANPGKYGAVENMRLRVIPVLGTSPAIFGQTMASFVLTQLGGNLLASCLPIHFSDLR